MEDKAILEEVHKRIANTAKKLINLALDAGALRLRALLQKRIETESRELQ